jgi:hypothetical protein
VTVDRPIRPSGYLGAAVGANGPLAAAYAKAGGSVAATIRLIPGFPQGSYAGLGGRRGAVPDRQ